MKSKSFPCETHVGVCPLMSHLDLISKKWSLQLLKALATEDSKRFNEMAKSVKGITPRILAQRLVEMERMGIVSKKKFHESPPRVEYFLTEKGRELTQCYRPGVMHIIKS
ncbi:MAG: helix-turn-helix transcriptional regulator [Candidatus Aenigmarchaeota archaeon]|nr:helix-turn-helix transcriptional regulator [Candidatus Aenigmarchaeota archaeon]